MRFRRAISLGVMVSALAFCGGNDSTAPPGPDLKSPVVAITAPAPGPVSGTVLIQATASDDRGVASVAFRVNGGAAIAVDSVAPFAYSWDTTTFGVGIYDWSATARDEAGNATVSATVRYTVAP